MGDSLGAELSDGSFVGESVSVPVGPFGAGVRGPVGTFVGVGLPSTSVGEKVGASVSLPVGSFGAFVGVGLPSTSVGEEVGVDVIVPVGPFGGVVRTGGVGEIVGTNVTVPVGTFGAGVRFLEDDGLQETSSVGLKVVPENVSAGVGPKVPAQSQPHSAKSNWKPASL